MDRQTVKCYIQEGGGGSEKERKKLKRGREMKWVCENTELIIA